MKLRKWIPSRIYAIIHKIKNRELWDAIMYFKGDGYKSYPLPLKDYILDLEHSTDSKIGKLIRNHKQKTNPLYIPFYKVECDLIPARKIKCVWNKEIYDKANEVLAIKVDDLLMGWDQPEESLNRVHKEIRNPTQIKGDLINGCHKKVNYLEVQKAFREREEGYWNWFEETYCNKNKKDNYQKGHYGKKIYQKGRRGRR